MGLILIIPAIALILWLLVALLWHAFGSSKSDRKVERVDIIEGGCIVEQQSTGRELWRRAEVEIPTRPLTFREELNLRSIRESDNRNVNLTPPPLAADDQEGR